MGPPTALPHGPADPAATAAPPDVVPIGDGRALACVVDPLRQEVWA